MSAAGPGERLAESIARIEGTRLPLIRHHARITRYTLGAAWLCFCDCGFAGVYHDWQRAMSRADRHVYGRAS